MAKFLDLATELMLAIASFVPRSSDRLSLALVNHEMYKKVIPILYKRIMLGQSRDQSDRDDLSWIRGDSCWDTIRLLSLSSALKTDTPSPKSVVESLDLELNSNTLPKSFECSDITLYLPRLKSFCLASKRFVGDKSERGVPDLSPSKIGRRLHGVRSTLQSLIIDIDQSPDRRDGSRIGSLRHFIALKHLGIQSHILIGECGDGVPVRRDGGRPLGFDWMMLIKILPEGLQKLQISCWVDGQENRVTIWSYFVVFLLEKLLKAGLDTLPALQHVTVYYPARDHAHAKYETISEETLRTGNDKSACLGYVRAGLWQELAEAFRRMALEKHRSVSILYEQGSQIGSRAWGETATESAYAWS